MRMKYDIFISYRRDGGAQYARILEIKLQQRGYNVFLDYDELTDGVFSDTIKTAIKESSIFMLVLSKESMYRCVNEDDWVRQEIALAIELKKHIVPINPDKEFDGFPESMPMALKEVVGSYQYSDIGFGEMLDVTVDFLVKNHLIPILGERKAKVHKDEELVTAKDERKSLFSLIRNLFIKEYKNESLLDNYIPDKVDFDILALGVFYIVVIAVYLLFENIVINYRPVLIDGVLEVSYPSSTTMLTLCVMPTAIMQFNKRIKNKATKKLVILISIIFTAFMVVGRILSGVHWITDIIGGLIFSAGMAVMYYSIIKMKRK